MFTCKYPLTYLLRSMWSSIVTPTYLMLMYVIVTIESVCYRLLLSIRVSYTPLSKHFTNFYLFWADPTIFDPTTNRNPTLITDLDPFSHRTPYDHTQDKVVDPWLVSTHKWNSFRYFDKILITEIHTKSNYFKWFFKWKRVIKVIFFKSFISCLFNVIPIGWKL